ncbi:MAG: GTP 3',8-cyclase MoaA [Taibaiella sp.]|nr:GTP 3',8-cyclase MoaA [Taibaiella sp.]
MLTDNHGRHINYLRLAVTDRCNLRCFYCMPEKGNVWLERKDLLSFEEMLRLCRLAVTMGIEKIRITGGEPFVRKGIMAFLTDLSNTKGLNELTITTNGVLTAPLVPELKKIGIKSVNLSLDTLDRDRFLAITHRDELANVLATMEALLRHGLEVKLNAVVMEGQNIQDILPLVQLTKNNKVTVRFIEEMPFNGGETHYPTLNWDHKKIYDTIHGAYPGIEKLSDPEYSTSYNYHIPGHTGNVGIIAAFTRSFCGTCNRLRITPQGILKTCLYQGGGTDIRQIIRQKPDNDTLRQALLTAISHRAKDGYEAERNRLAGGIHESMATIGG